MIVETDVVDDESNGCASFALAIELHISDDQIDAFNKAMAEKVTLIRRSGIMEHHRGEFAGGSKHLLLWKNYCADDFDDRSTQPFMLKQEAEDMLIELWSFCGEQGRPEIQCKEV